MDAAVLHICENEFVMSINGRNKLTNGTLRLPRKNCLYNQTRISPLGDDGDMSLGIFYSVNCDCLVRSVAATPERMTLGLLPFSSDLSFPPLTLFLLDTPW